MQGSVNFVTPEMADAVSKTNGGTFSGNITIDKKNGTTSADGASTIIAGNNTASGTAKNSYGELRLYGKGSNYIVVDAAGATANRRIHLPNKPGTLFLEEGGTFSGNITVDRSDGTVESLGYSNIWAGNSISSGTAGNSRGQLCLYSDKSNYSILRSAADGTNPVIIFPNEGGTVMLNNGGYFKGNVYINTSGVGTLITGNATPTGTTGSSYGQIHIYGEGQHAVVLQAKSTTSDTRIIEFPDKAGTVALTEDISVDDSYYSGASGFTTSIDALCRTVLNTNKQVTYFINSSSQITDYPSTLPSVQYVFVTLRNYQSVTLIEIRNGITLVAFGRRIGNDAFILQPAGDFSSLLSNGNSISLADFITANSAITISSVDVVKTGNHVSAKLVCSGDATISAAGRIVVGSIKTAYRPSRRQVVATMINKSAGGQIYQEATIDIDTTGSVTVNCGGVDINTTIGNATYPWCTTQGLIFDYWL